MTTRNLVPRLDNEGHIGVEDKKWQGMATYTLTVTEILSPVIDAIHATLGTKAAQTAVDAIELTLATKAAQADLETVIQTLETKATQADLEAVATTADAAAPQSYVDAKFTEVNESIQSNLSPFERDENGDLMPKVHDAEGGGVEHADS